MSNENISKILVFTGAGIGVPIGLPTTNDFKDIIEKNLDGELVILLKEFLNNNHHDIEYILGELEVFLYKKTFLKHVLKKNKNSHFQQVNLQLSTLNNQAEELIHNLKKAIFEKLKGFKEKEASRLLFSLVREIKTTIPQSAISFFTTNYDLTFEHMIDDQESELKAIGIQDIELGFDLKRNGDCFNNSRSYNWETSIMEYKKLHGSLDWIERSGKYIRLKGFAIPDKPDDMLLLFPGYKETPESDPYKSIHDQLLIRLSDADIVVTVGFAFRDPYINSIFDTAIKINKDIIIFCINPKKTTELPLESRINYFTRNYPNNFFHLNTAIKIENLPLGVTSYRDYVTKVKTKRQKDFLQSILPF